MRQPLSFPPDHGPGSSKAEWRAFAYELVELVSKASEINDACSNEIAYLKGELELMRQRVAAKKPKGGKTRLPDETVRRIKAAIRSGCGVRAIAKTYRVSAMTVSRYKKAMQAETAE